MLNVQPALAARQQSNETHYHRDTSKEVRAVLEGYKGRRVRIFYGDTIFGRCWNDEWHTIGEIGRSTGTKKIPLLVANSRSMGGDAILDHCIIAVQVAAGQFVYQHPLFHTGEWIIGPPTHEGYAASVLHNGKQHAQFRKPEQARAYIAFMKGERWSKTPKACDKEATNV